MVGNQQLNSQVHTNKLAMSIISSRFVKQARRILSVVLATTLLSTQPVKANPAIAAPALCATGVGCFLVGAVVIGGVTYYVWKNGGREILADAYGRLIEYPEHLPNTEDEPHEEYEEIEANNAAQAKRICNRLAQQYGGYLAETPRAIARGRFICKIIVWR